MNPHLQQKVFEEITEVVGSDLSTPCSYASLQQLKYLEMFIKETMRLHPTVPVIGRQAIDKIQIQGVEIPAGVDITIPIYAIHLNPSIYPGNVLFYNQQLITGTSETGCNVISFTAATTNIIGSKVAYTS